MGMNSNKRREGQKPQIRARRDRGRRWPRRQIFPQIFHRRHSPPPRPAPAVTLCFWSQLVMAAAAAAIGVQSAGFLTRAIG